MITKIQNEIKSKMKYEDNFNMNIICDVFNTVENDLKAYKENLKSSRVTTKMCDKFYNDGSLVKHDEKMKKINNEIIQLKKLDKYDFLINGKYYEVN